MQGKESFTSIKEDFNDGVTFELDIGGTSNVFVGRKYWEGIPGWEIILTTLRFSEVQGMIREWEKSITMTAQHDYLG